MVTTNDETHMLIVSGLLHQLNDTVVRCVKRRVTIDLNEFVSRLKTSVERRRRIRHDAADGHLRFFFFTTENSQTETITRASMNNLSLSPSR